MRTPDAEFEHELEVFRTEAEAGTQFFYAFLTIHAVAADHNAVLRALNHDPLFWNTILGALQTATFIALGRVFDQGSPHNVDKALRIAQDHPEIFSRASLGRRKQGTSKTAPQWLQDYLFGAYEPAAADFRRLRAHVRRRRRIYETSYRDLRNKVFAHKDLVDRRAISALFAKTNIRELQRLFAFLNSLHDSLWELFFNGRKLILRPRRFSLRRMRDLPSPAERRKGVHERIIHEAEEFLTAAVGVSQPSVTGGASQAARP